MADNRRQFIKRSGLLMGGAVALSAAGTAAAAPAKRNTPNSAKSLTALLTRLRVKSAHLTGGSVLGTSFTPACVSIAALVGSPAAIFAQLQKDMPFSEAWADGATVLLRDESAYYRINFYDRAGWNALRTNLAAGTGIRFAHQAMMRDRNDAAAAVTDPFGVIAAGGRTLRTVGTQDGSLAARVRTVLEGASESALYALTPSPAFAALRTAVLNGLPADDAQARVVVDEFTALAAVLAAHCGNMEVTTLLESPLVSSSMLRVFGRSGPEIVRTASALSVVESDTPAGAPWLAAILGMENLSIIKGAVSIEHEDRYASLQARTALLKARAAWSTHS